MLFSWDSKIINLLKSNEKVLVQHFIYLSFLFIIDYVYKKCKEIIKTAHANIVITTSSSVKLKVLFMVCLSQGR